MSPAAELLVDITFEAELVQWRGPAPFFFLVVPDEHVGELKYAARLASYGWGAVPVTASIGGTEFKTSLFPRDGGYLLPIKAAVRRENGIVPGAVVRTRLLVFARGGGSGDPADR